MSPNDRPATMIEQGCATKLSVTPTIFPGLAPLSPCKYYVLAPAARASSQLLMEEGVQSDRYLVLLYDLLNVIMSLLRNERRS